MVINLSKATYSTSSVRTNLESVPDKALCILLRHSRDI